MNNQQYAEELKKQLKLQSPYGFDFWNHQDTFSINQIDDIVEHGISEEFTPSELANRLLEIVLQS